YGRLPPEEFFSQRVHRIEKKSSARLAAGGRLLDQQIHHRRIVCANHSFVSIRFNVKTIAFPFRPRRMKSRDRPARAAEKREPIIFARQMPNLVASDAEDFADIAENICGEINNMNPHVHQRATADDRFVVFPRRAKLRQTLMPGEHTNVIEFPDDAIGKSAFEEANSREITMIETGRWGLAALLRGFGLAK